MLFERHIALSIAALLVFIGLPLLWSFILLPFVVGMAFADLRYPLASLRRCRASPFDTGNGPN